MLWFYVWGFLNWCRGYVTALLPKPGYVLMPVNNYRVLFTGRAIYTHIWTSGNARYVLEKVSQRHIKIYVCAYIFPTLHIVYHSIQNYGKLGFMNIAQNQINIIWNFLLLLLFNQNDLSCYLNGELQNWINRCPHNIIQSQKLRQYNFQRPNVPIIRV